MNKFSVILFYSNNYALWTAKILKDAGYFNKMTPVPRHLSSDCGYCVKIKSKDHLSIKTIINKKKIEYYKISEI
jgi:putative Se/S carrier protein